MQHPEQLNVGIKLWCLTSYHHFQQFFSFIMAISFIDRVPEENHRPAASH